MYKHFIWDFDGTLFDSYPAMVKAFQKTLADLGVEMSEEAILMHMKISIKHLIEHCTKTYGTSENFYEEFDEVLKVYEAQLVKPYSGNIDVCKSICERGGKNYVYTHRGASTYKYLEKYDMVQYFEEVVTSENGFARKPDPEAVSHLLEAHNIQPEEAILIGDRELDIVSGQNAGIKGCFYRERPEFVCDLADYEIVTFRELLNL